MCINFVYFYGIFFVIYKSGKFTVDKKGKEDIKISTTGAEKLSFTVVLGVTLEGGKCPPMIIFKNLKKIPKQNFPSGIVVKVNKNGWMTEEIMKEWVTKYLLERPNPAENPNDSLLIMDSAPSHITVAVKEAVKKVSKIAIIPGGMTKLLQPLDISVNKSFKRKIRKKWEEWISDEKNHTYTKNGNLRRASYAEVARWVYESFNSISKECIQNSSY